MYICDDGKLQSGLGPLEDLVTSDVRNLQEPGWFHTVCSACQLVCNLCELWLWLETGLSGCIGFMLTVF